MQISQWTKAELDNESDARRARIKRIVGATTPTELLEAVKDHTVTEQRCRVWLTGIIQIVEDGGKGHNITLQRLELHRQALTLMNQAS